MADFDAQRLAVRTARLFAQVRMIAELIDALGGQAATDA